MANKYVDMHTPEPSTERKRAGKLGYIVAILTSGLLFIGYPIFAPYTWTAFLPVILGFAMYFGWRIITGDLDKESTVKYLKRRWISLGQ